MEFAFNSVWALVAFASLCLWLAIGRRTAADRRLSLIGLVMLVVILFPVISVSDDLWSIQNPAETDSCQRRDHRDLSAHTPFPASTALPEQARFELMFEFMRADLPRVSILPPIENPAFDPVENRPPPLS